MLLLLTPRYHALKNRLTRLAPGDGLKTAVLDLLALRLMSMVLLMFFSILVFSNIVTSLSTFYLSGKLDILHSAELWGNPIVPDSPPR